MLNIHQTCSEAKPAEKVFAQNLDTRAANAAKVHAIRQMIAAHKTTSSAKKQAPKIH